MMDMDNFLDFESEDPLLNRPAVTKKRKKAIGLDDLLTDFYKEEDKLVEKKSKRAKPRRNNDSDEEDNHKEAALYDIVDKCENEMREISGKEDSFVWGICAFGDQKTPPPLSFPEIKSCTLLQSFINDELNSVIDISTENGDTFLEGLLVNGWLSKLVFASRHLEKSVATWTFNLMLYSPKEDLRASACDFWCAILSFENEVDLQPIKIDWFPSYSELKIALESYGFLFKLSSNTDSACSNSASRGPAQNIRAWLKLATASCQMRNKRAMYLTSEAEELIEVIICLFSDRQLQGLLVLLHECMQSAISYFTNEEWESSCEKIAKSLACRVPKDLNCLRIVECISVVNTRSKLFRSTVAHQILLSYFDHKAPSEEGILKLLIPINVKDKSCDFFKMYIHLVLTENWLLSNQLLEDKPVLKAMWRLYLRNCSCMIASTDLRCFASKVRNKASYLLQGTVS
ncbi:hypothetical protein PRUPE_6G111800 [Prunus persica]|uniref:Coiled-coil SMC6 And NSE5 INteracting (CANIN) domain-containing protein n=2 Tax=Prunus persica TaxID=3760 RepID=M5W453_PRUPE|nr:uncharacterized protein LOC18773642 [Prunus persica]ONI00919.1 hypothetical protein PRUPE_6G111800 [Prunus persica]ONI00920.1 hypothetical protein PRUPE_6G111800 [Prunus persica]